jgi:hypothetical protein
MDGMDGMDGMDARLGVALNLKTEVPAERLKGRKCDTLAFSNFQNVLRVPRGSA